MKAIIVLLKTKIKLPLMADEISEVDLFNRVRHNPDDRIACVNKLWTLPLQLSLP